MASLDAIRTNELFWTCMWRVSLLYLGLIVSCGILYGGVSAVCGLFLPGAVEYARTTPEYYSQPVQVIGIVLFILVFFIPGAVIGGLQALIFGPFFATFTGLLTFAITRLFATMRSDIYVFVVRVSCALATLAGLLTIWAWLDFDQLAFVLGGNSTPFGEPQSQSDSQITDILIFEVGSILISMWVAQFSGKKFAELYITQRGEPRTSR